MRSTPWLVFVGLLAAAPIAPAQQLQKRHALKAYEKPASDIGITGVALSADGKIVAAAIRHVDTKVWKRWTEFRVWDAVSKKELAAFEKPVDDSSSLALSPTGDMLASSSFRGESLLWSVKDGTERKFGNLDGLGTRLRFSDDGGRIAAASEKGITLATAPGDAPTSVKYRGRSGPRTFSPDLRFLACSCHQDVDLFDPTTGKLQATLPDHPGSVSDIAFSGDSKTAAVLVRTYEESGGYGSQIFLWDVSKQTVKSRFKDLGYCTSLGVGDDGKFVLAMTDMYVRPYGCELRAIDTGTGKITSTFVFSRGQSPSHSPAFSRDARVVAIGCHDGSVLLFDVR